jgi:hypothetical protein
MIGRSFAILACLAAACSPTPPPSSPAVAAALDSFAPGVRIGARAAPIAAQLQLGFAPYVGYADTAFRRTRGVHGIVLRVAEELNSKEQRPSRGARIGNVGIGFDSRDAGDAAREFLTRQLGPPNTFCYVAADGWRRVALYFWPDRMSEGVLLTVPLQPAERPFVTFAVREPDPNRSDSRACGAA